MAQVREPGEGRERPGAGAALDPERTGARERTPGRPEMGAESAGGGERARRELGTSLSLPLGAGWWPGASELCSTGDKREPRAGTEPGAALKGSVRWRWYPGLLMGPAPEELVSVTPGIRSSLERARPVKPQTLVYSCCE